MTLGSRRPCKFATEGERENSPRCLTFVIIPCPSFPVRCPSQKKDQARNSLSFESSTWRPRFSSSSPGCATRRGNLLCNGCAKDRVVHRAAVHPPCTFAERNGRYFAKLKREPHAIQARAYARMRQTRARILHVCFLLYTHLSCSPPYVYVSVNYERLLVIRSGRVGGNRSIRFARLFISIYIYIYPTNSRREKGFDSLSIPLLLIDRSWGFIKNSCIGISFVSVSSIERYFLLLSVNAVCDRDEGSTRGTMKHEKS